MGVFYNNLKTSPILIVSGSALQSTHKSEMSAMDPSGGLTGTLVIFLIRLLS